MTLGITIQNKDGIAFGADSLVSHVSHTINTKDLIQAILCMDEDTPLVKENLVKAIVEVSEKSVSRIHRSSKIRPIYKIGSVFYGARITSGNGCVGSVEDSVLDELDEDDVERSFVGYINEFHLRLKAKVEQAEGKPWLSQPLFVGYCTKKKKYETCISTIKISKSHEDEKFEMEFSISDRSGSFVSHVGDGSIVDTLLTGSSGILDSQLIDHLHSTLAIFGVLFAKGQTVALDKALQVIVSGTKVLYNDGMIDVSLLKGLLDKLKACSDSDGNIGDSDFAGVLMRLSGDALAKKISQGKSIAHFQHMSLRELLKIIEFLIQTTARVHEYINDDIPSVGGDLYFATITKTEGLVFRNLSDPF